MYMKVNGKLKLKRKLLNDEIDFDFLIKRVLKAFIINLLIF